MPKRIKGSGRFYEPNASRHSKDGGHDCGGEDRHSSTAAASEELQQLRRGELTEEQYFESRIAHATLHLSGRVSGRKLERIRMSLKRICASDPVLLAMRERVLRAKGKSGSGG